VHATSSWQIKLTSDYLAKVAKLCDIDRAMLAVVSREDNIRAGFVNVISHMGALGDRMSRSA